MPGFLETLPLHTITAVYGEAGLRDRFSREILRFSERDWRRLSEALALASDLHRQDRRAAEPTINHLLRVTLRVMCHYRVDDVDVLVAALLHDSVEDHPADLAGDGDPRDPREAALGVLEAEFGPRVAGLVEAVTNPVYDRSRDVHAQYRAHVTESLDRHPAARIIKVSDFTDNGVGLMHTTGPKVRKLARKYRPLVPALKDLVDRPDTPLDAEVKRHITGQLDRADERFAAILHR
ncbi:HD domain-containing protein [Actinomadura sp. LD22]|uniref:HD domain-containing protein n=1 Tax=Actinomadura physcomitrii TaxID=2650748 RepID=A0A6I4MJM6_9ACTN|nr:HD domain-containing protein [Actinomadura physcomitrii]MWA02849.1 HD domain-containing protein [Actinomadura physcomitrii]